MKKASDLYSLTRRELILLEMFNMLDFALYLTD